MFCGLTHNLTDHIYLPCICTYIKYRNALLKRLLTPISDWNSSQISSEACYSCCSNKPRTHQWGHLQRPPLRPPAICGLVWAAVLLAPLALWWAAPPVLFNYLHDGVSSPPAESLCQGHPGHMRPATLIDIVMTALPLDNLYICSLLAASGLVIWAEPG